MLPKNSLISSYKINQKDRFPVKSIIYLLIATCDSTYLHLFLWILPHFIIYIISDQVTSPCDSVYLHLFLWILPHFIIYIHKRSGYFPIYDDEYECVHFDDEYGHVHYDDVMMMMMIIMSRMILKGLLTFERLAMNN